MAFVIKIYTDYAARLGARNARIKAAREAADAAFAAKWDTPTKAAQAQPHRACKRCGGVGRLATYSHVADGHCFRCDGLGVR